MADYIERQAAFNMMFSRANPYGGQEKVNPADIWNQAATIIRTMPAAPVHEYVQAEWIKSSTGSCCSNCKTEGSPSWIACPVCSAHMVGGGER